ncbi:MAG: hypothetical protein R3A10_14910 [Caldilineaceae bacterium]
MFKILAELISPCQGQVAYAIEGTVPEMLPFQPPAPKRRHKPRHQTDGADHAEDEPEDEPSRIPARSSTCTGRAIHCSTPRRWSPSTSTWTRRPFLSSQYRPNTGGKHRHPEDGGAAHAHGLVGC